MHQIKGKQLSDGVFSKSSTKPTNPNSDNNPSVIARFRTVPEMWIKEYTGLKNNTIRIVHKDDIRFQRLRDWNHTRIEYVEIEQTTDGKVFQREISDVSFWFVKDVEICITTWEHDGSD